MSCPVSELMERLIEKFVTVTVTRVEAALDVVVLRAHVALLEEAVLKGGDSKVLGQLIAKRAELIANRMTVPAASTATGGALLGTEKSNESAGRKPDASSPKPKRGRPRKTEADSGDTAGAGSEVASSADPTLFIKE